MEDQQSVAPPADLTRRIAESERRQDRLEAEVSNVVKAMDGLTDKLSNFLREYNQRSRTDWKTLIALVGVLVTLGTAALGGAAWIVMTVEGGREQRALALIEVLAEGQAGEAERRDQIDNRIIDDYRREGDALRDRIERLEHLHMRQPD
jgi:cell division protein FtsB